MVRKLAAALVAAACCLGAIRAPAAAARHAAAFAEPPVGAPATVLTAYLTDLQHRDYSSAFSLLAIDDRRYFRRATNFASVFEASRVHVESFRLATARRSGRSTVYLVSERAAFLDYRLGEVRQADARVLYGVLLDGGAWRVHDPGHPWRSFASQSSARRSGLLVESLVTSYFARRLELVVRFTDEGSAAVTVLPYGRGLLTDDRGGVYHPLISRDPRLTSRALFEGIRLAPHSRYTGFLDFETPAFDDSRRRLTLRIEPVLPQGAARPFALTVGPISG